MKKNMFLTALILLATGSSAFAQNLVDGTYNCKVVGSSSISDGRGSSVKFVSGKLTVGSDKVSLDSKGIFNVLGRKPRVETLSVKGSGKLKNLENPSDSTQGGSASFAVSTSKKVVYRGRTLTGLAIVRLLAGTDGATVNKVASVDVRTNIGIFKLSCS